MGGQGLLRAGGINPSSWSWIPELVPVDAWLWKRGVKVCMSFALEYEYRNYICLFLVAASCTGPTVQEAVLNLQDCKSTKHARASGMCASSPNTPTTYHLIAKSMWTCHRRAQPPVWGHLCQQKTCQLRQDMLKCFQQLDFFGVLKENLLSSWCFSDKKNSARSNTVCFVR